MDLSKQRLQPHPRTGQAVRPYTALAVLSDPRVVHTDEGYWHRGPPHRFERLVAAAAIKHGQTFGAFVVPAVGASVEEGGAWLFREPVRHLALRSRFNEYHMLLGVSFDVNDGLDGYRCRYALRPNGEPASTPWSS